MGGYYKLPDGTRVQVVGIVEDGKYTANLAEDPQPAMFLPILQSFNVNLENSSSDVWLVVRSSRDPQQVAAAIRSNRFALGARVLDALMSVLASRR